MPEHPLKIINTTSSQNQSSFDDSFREPLLEKQIREMQAKFERLWLIDPERFNPLRNCLQRERLDRMWQLLVKHTHLGNKSVADIGCGSGVFSRQLRDAGASVEAVDIAENALKHFKEAGADNIQLKQDAMPSTHLPDNTYDIIVCTELIAELPPEDYRLFFAELARIINANGQLLCSSDIDIDSVGGIERFVEFAQTEFDLFDSVASYHALYLWIKRFFESPSQFIEGWKNPQFKKKKLSMKRGFDRGWFWINTTPLFIPWWFAGEFFSRPFLKILRKNKKILLFLERVCRFMWDSDGISHYIFIAKRRPLKPIEPKDIPIEKPKRKEVWD